MKTQILKLFKTYFNAGSFKEKRMVFDLNHKINEWVKALPDQVNELGKPEPTQKQKLETETADVINTVKKFGEILKEKINTPDILRKFLDEPFIQEASTDDIKEIAKHIKTFEGIDQEGYLTYLANKLDPAQRGGILATINHTELDAFEEQVVLLAKVDLEELKDNGDQTFQSLIKIGKFIGTNLGREVKKTVETVLKKAKSETENKLNSAGFEIDGNSVKIKVPIAVGDQKKEVARSFLLTPRFAKKLENTNDPDSIKKVVFAHLLSVAKYNENQGKNSSRGEWKALNEVLEKLIGGGKETEGPNIGDQERVTDSRSRSTTTTVQAKAPEGQTSLKKIEAAGRKDQPEPIPVEVPAPKIEAVKPKLSFEELSNRINQALPSGDQPILFDKKGEKITVILYAGKNPEIAGIPFPSITIEIKEGNVIASYKRPIIGDKAEINLGSNPTPEEIREKLTGSGGLREEIREDMNLLQTFGGNLSIHLLTNNEFREKIRQEPGFRTKLLTSTEKSNKERAEEINLVSEGKAEIESLKLLGIERNYYLKNNEIKNWLNDRKTFRKNFNNLQKHKVITKSLMDLGVKDSDEAADIIFDALGYGDNEYININNIFRALANRGYGKKIEGLFDRSSTEYREGFEKFFNQIFKEAREAKENNKPLSKEQLKKLETACNLYLRLKILAASFAYQGIYERPDATHHEARKADALERYDVKAKKLPLTVQELEEESNREFNLRGGYFRNVEKAKAKFKELGINDHDKVLSLLNSALHKKPEQKITLKNLNEAAKEIRDKELVNIDRYKELMTKEKKTEEELKELDSLKKEFITTTEILKLIADFIPSETIEQALEESLTKGFGKDASGVYVAGQKYTNRQMHTRETQPYGERTETESFINPKLIPKEILKNEEVRVESDGKKETIKIYDLTPEGLKVYNEKGIIKYLNHLKAKGVKTEILQRKLSDAAKINDALEEHYTNAELISKTNDLTKLEGYQDVERILTNEPFKFKAEEVKNIIKTIYETHKKEHSGLGFTVENEKVGALSKVLFQRINSRKFLPHGAENISDLLQKQKKLSKKENLTESEKETLVTLNIVLNKVKKLALALNRLENKKETNLSGNSAHQLLDHLNQLTDEDRKYILKGFEAEKRSENLEELSSYPEIEKIQKEAIKAGYPKEELYKIEDSLLAIGLGVSFKGGELENIGAGIAIPIGNGFAVGLGGSLKGVSAGVGIRAVVYKGDGHGMSWNAGAGFTIGDRITPGFALGVDGYVDIGESDVMSDNMRFLYALGLIWNGKKIPKLGAMVGIGHNLDGEIRQAHREFLEKVKDIEKPQSIDEKADAIRKHEQFEDLEPPELKNEDLISLYEQWKDMSLKKATEDAVPDIPINKIGAGIAIDFEDLGNSQFMMAVGFTVGSEVIYRPQKEQNQRRIESNVEAKFRRKFEQKDTQNIQFIKEESEQVFIDGDGNYKIDRNKEPEISMAELDPEQGMTQVKEAFRKAHLNLSTSPTTINGFKYYEISPFLETEKDQDVKIIADPDSNIKLHYEGGKVYLLGNFQNIVALKRSFSYYGPKEEGLASGDTVIMLSTNQNASIKKALAESNYSLVSRIQEGKRKGFIIEEGQNYGATKINISGKGSSRKEAWGAKDIERGFVKMEEREYAGMPEKEFRKVLEIRDKNINNLSKKNFNYEDLLERRNLEIKAEIFPKINEDLRKGTLPINNPRAIIEKLNTFFTEPLNAKEAREALRVIQNEYFIDLFGERKNKADIIKQFKEHNQAISKKLLTPKFKEASSKLKLNVDIDKLVKEVHNRAVQKFVSGIDEFEKKHGKINSKDKVREFIEFASRPIDANMRILTGTTIRETGEGTFTVTETDFKEMPSSLLFEKSEWPIDSPIGQILMEISRPTPDFRQPESVINNPMILELMTTAGLGAAIGAENYEIVSEFYLSKPESQAEKLRKIENNPKLATALENLKNFVLKIKDAERKGIKEIELKGGSKFFIEVPKIYTGSYLDCGNHTILLAEQRYRFGVPIKPITGEGAKESAFIHGTNLYDVDTWEFGAGLLIGAGENEEEGKDKGKIPPPPEDGKDKQKASIPF